MSPSLTTSTRWRTPSRLLAAADSPPISSSPASSTGYLRGQIQPVSLVTDPTMPAPTQPTGAAAALCPLLALLLLAVASLGL